MLRTGTYRDAQGVLVHVRRTATGYVVTYPNGRAVVLGARP